VPKPYLPKDLVTRLDAVLAAAGPPAVTPAI